VILIFTGMSEVLLSENGFNYNYGKGFV